MSWLYGIAIGIAAGVVVGALAERLPMSPLLRSLGAAAGAMVLAAVTLTFVWIRLPRAAGSGGLGAVSAGITELAVLLLVPAFLAAVAGLHYALGRLGASAPWIAAHRAIVVGCIAGVCGTLPVAWLMWAVERAAGAD